MNAMKDFMWAVTAQSKENKNVYIFKTYMEYGL